ncbi:unnamed protein product, partial [Scytosiphon promiscuus]
RSLQQPATPLCCCPGACPPGGVISGCSLLRWGPQQITQGPAPGTKQRVGGLAASVRIFSTLCCVRETCKKRVLELAEPPTSSKAPKRACFAATRKSSALFLSGNHLAKVPGRLSRFLCGSGGATSYETDFEFHRSFENESSRILGQDSKSKGGVSFVIRSTTDSEKLRSLERIPEDFGFSFPEKMFCNESRTLREKLMLQTILPTLPVYMVCC